MAYELRDGQGTLFRNERKETEKHPDYTGSIKLPDGSECWLSGWIKQGAKGKFFSLQIGKPKNEAASKPAARKPVADDMSDEIPF
jgi:hypothetical protein